jgi:hypothetical protein
MGGGVGGVRVSKIGIQDVFAVENIYGRHGSGNSDFSLVHVFSGQK